MKMIKRMLQLTVTLLLIFWVVLPGASFSEVDQQAIQTQIQNAITAAQAAGQVVDAAMIETIAGDIMAQNVASDDDPFLQVEAVADAIVQAVVALNASLGLNQADVVLAASRGAVQGVRNLVETATIPESLSSALQVSAIDGATAGAQQAGISMDTIMLIGSTTPAPGGEDEPDPADTEPLDPAEAEAFEPAGDPPAPAKPAPPLTPTPLQDLGDSSPL